MYSWTNSLTNFLFYKIGAFLNNASKLRSNKRRHMILTSNNYLDWDWNSKSNTEESHAFYKSDLFSSFYIRNTFFFCCDMQLKHLHILIFCIICSFLNLYMGCMSFILRTFFFFISVYDDWTQDILEKNTQSTFINLLIQMSVFQFLFPTTHGHSKICLHWEP